MALFLFILNIIVYSVFVSASNHSGSKPILYTGCVRPDHVALTFDDGLGHYTEELLDTLAYHHVKATFFILGQSISDTNGYYEEHRKLLLRMVREGHDIGSHSWDHPDFTKLSKDEIEAQLQRTDAAVKDIIGVRPRYIRPPFGHMNKKVLKLLNAFHYIPVTWNKDTNDWQHQDDHDAIVDFIKQEIDNPRRHSEGPIILQHDTLQSSILLQGKIIRSLRKKGYKIVPLHECLDIKPYRR